MAVKAFNLNSKSSTTPMKKFLLLFLLPFFLMFSACETLETSLTDEEIVAGLKEALQVASDTSVAKGSQPNGYYQNTLIRIAFPEDVANVATTVGNFTILGQPVGQTAVDGFVLKLNRAAEGAADRALPIFVNAITGMTITDGLNILMGHDSSATEFLRTSTYTSLKTEFKPEIATSLDQVGAQTAWGEVTTIYNTVAPNNPVNVDLADYTTGKALDGLFTLVAREETRIRLDPVARVTDLLAKVFAEQDN